MFQSPNYKNSPLRPPSSERGALKALGCLMALWILGAPTLWAQNIGDSRNMNIPTEPSEIDSALQNASPAYGGSEIRLHYNIGLLEKVTGFVYTQGRIQEELAEGDIYMGIEPSSFSKPTESLYKQKIGFMAGNFKRAVASNPESVKEINRYQLLKAASILFLTAAAVTGGATLVGLAREESYFGSNRDRHILYGTGITFALTGSAILPSLFNRGRIQRAATLHNRSLRPAP